MQTSEKTSPALFLPGAHDVRIFVFARTGVACITFEAIAV
jgi:hypothetical protein